MPEFVKSDPNAALEPPKEPEKTVEVAEETKERKTLYDQLKESKGM